MEVTLNENMTPLANLLGTGSLVGGKDEAAKYFASMNIDGDFLVVCPGTTEEVQRVLSYAREMGIPVYTLKDDFLPAWISGEKGIILDTSMMKSIEKIDIDALAVNVEPGVTYEELREELNRYGLKTLMPAVATSPYVARNSVNRALMQAASRYPETQFSNLAVVLPDSRIFKTGGHALTDEYADWKDVLGPHLEKWFHASEEIYGLITRATIWTYKRLDGREAGLFYFDERDKMLGFLKEVSRKELCQEAMGFNSSAVSRILEREFSKGWYALVGNESFAEHVKYQVRKVRQICKNWKGEKTKEKSKDLLQKMEIPWIHSPTEHLGFYALYSRAPELDNYMDECFLSGKKSENELEKYFISVSFGRTIYMGYRIPGLNETRYLDVAVEAIARGAFFNRPLGKLAEYYYPKTTNYLEMMRRVKNMLDPEGYLNPHQPYWGWNE